MSGTRPLGGIALAALLAACGGGSNDADAGAAGDATALTSCQVLGGEARLRIAFEGEEHRGSTNWMSEGVECDGSFGELTLSWEMPDLHSFTLTVQGIEPTAIIDAKPAQLSMVLVGDAYETAAGGCTADIENNVEHDADSLPGVFLIEGTGRCSEYAYAPSSDTEYVQILANFAFAGYASNGE